MLIALFSRMKTSCRMFWRICSTPKETTARGIFFCVCFSNNSILAPDAKLTKGATVHREVPTHGILKYLRRMDVLVEAGMLKVAIENKVDSIDQPEQVKDYLEHLRYCTRVPPARSMLIYLTPDGRPPESISREVVDREVAGKNCVAGVMADDLRAWLEECRSQCEAREFAILFPISSATSTWY